MPTQFQPSYIPKSPSATSRGPRLGSLLTIFASIVFILTIGGGVALYILTDYTSVQIVEKSKELQDNQERLDLTLARDLIDLDRRIISAKMLLSKHVVISPIFQAIQDATLKTVRFTSLQFDSKDGKYTLAGNGKALSYSAIALQSDEYAKPGNRERITNPVFSGLGLDQGGNVVFNFNADVVPALLDYESLFGSNSQTQ